MINKPKPVKTLGSTLSAAEICRRNGWRRGTRIVAGEGERFERMRITAVGDEEILVIDENPNCSGLETGISLYYRDWRKAVRG